VDANAARASVSRCPADALFGRGGGHCQSTGGHVGFWSMPVVVWWRGLAVVVLSFSFSPMCVLSWVRL
jgi:hypothetical protein